MNALEYWFNRECERRLYDDSSVFEKEACESS